MSEIVSRNVAEKVLEKLGYSKPPAADFEGLKGLYQRWCRNVPFDNVRKLIHVRAGDPGTLPGDTPDDYFANWLKHGTGGTCWAGNGALQALLVSLGFEATRGVATMMVAPGLPPNHGTVVVKVNDVDYLTDASILHSEPLSLKPGRETVLTNGAWRTRSFQRDGHWIIAWFPMMRPEGLECMINYVPAEAGEYHTRHEHTRGWSPFNYELNTRKIVGESSIGLVLGTRAEFNRKGEYTQQPMDQASRLKCLIEELGYSEEIASKIPADEKTPPPPGTKAAMEASR